MHLRNNSSEINYKSTLLFSIPIDDCNYTPWRNASICNTTCGTCKIKQERAQTTPLPYGWNEMCLNLEQIIEYEIKEDCPSKFVSLHVYPSGFDT